MTECVSIDDMGATYSLSEDWTADTAGWRYVEEGHGDWRAVHDDGRRTPLMRSLERAQIAVKERRFVCVQYPFCKHEHLSHCIRMVEINPKLGRTPVREVARRRVETAASVAVSTHEPEQAVLW